MRTSGKTEPAIPPCGKHLGIGETAVLREGTIYCEPCGDQLALVPHASERRFTLERGVVCGGGAPLD